MPDELEYWDSHQDVMDEASRAILKTLADESDTRFGSLDPIKIAYGPDWYMYGGLAYYQEQGMCMTNPSKLSPIQRFQRAANHVLKKVQQTRRWEFLRARRAAIKEYETIAVAAGLDSLAWMTDGPRYLSEADQKTLDRLVLVLAPRDLAYCRAKGEIEMNKTYTVHLNVCVCPVFAECNSR